MFEAVLIGAVFMFAAAFAVSMRQIEKDEKEKKYCILTQAPTRASIYLSALRSRASRGQRKGV